MLATQAIKSWSSLLGFQRSPKDSPGPIRCALFQISPFLPLLPVFPPLLLLNVLVTLLLPLRSMSDRSAWPESNHR